MSSQGKFRRIRREVLISIRGLAPDGSINPSPHKEGSPEAKAELKAFAQRYRDVIAGYVVKLRDGLEKQKARNATLPEGYPDLEVIRANEKDVEAALEQAVGELAVAEANLEVEDIS